MILYGANRRKDKINKEITKNFFLPQSLLKSIIKKGIQEIVNAAIIPDNFNIEKEPRIIKNNVARNIFL